MRILLPGALLLAVAAVALLVPSCGGSKEKEGLRAYEAGVEDLMAEDAKVSAHLDEIRGDLDVANAATDAETRFARDEAVPFFRRFKEKASSVPAEDPRLSLVHGVLTEYLDQRLAYLEATEAFLGAARSDEIRALEAAQDPWQVARRALAEAAGGSIEDREVVDAVGSGELFLQRRFEPYSRGQLPRADVERTLRQEILPRLARIAERTSASVRAEGLEGATARWARAEYDFYDRLLGSLARQESLQKNMVASRASWERSRELREKYLSSLKAYRESLR